MRLSYQTHPFLGIWLRPILLWRVWILRDTYITTPGIPFERTQQTFIFRKNKKTHFAEEVLNLEQKQLPSMGVNNLLLTLLFHLTCRGSCVCLGVCVSFLWGMKRKTHFHFCRHEKQLFGGYNELVPRTACALQVYSNLQDPIKIVIWVNMLYEYSGK